MGLICGYVLSLSLYGHILAGYIRQRIWESETVSFISLSISGCAHAVSSIEFLYTAKCTGAWSVA